MERTLIGYVRVAPRERPEERPDLAAQRVAIAEAAERQGWNLLRIEEDVRSGRSLRRPGLRAALAACEAGEAEGVIVARLDRLTYRLTDLADLAGRALAGSFSIVALDLDLDFATQPGRTAARVLATAAEWTPPALAEPARRLGRPGRPSSTPPEVAARIHELRDDGMTLQAICDTLNEDRVPTPRGGTHWRPTSLRSILTAGPTDAGTA